MIRKCFLDRLLNGRRDFGSGITLTALSACYLPCELLRLSAIDRRLLGLSCVALTVVGAACFGSASAKLVLELDCVCESCSRCFTFLGDNWLVVFVIEHSFMCSAMYLVTSVLVHVQSQFVTRQ
jgi:hypothetical protein